MGFIILGSHHNDRKGHYLSEISKSMVFLYIWYSQWQMTNRKLILPTFKFWEYGVMTLKKSHVDRKSRYVNPFPLMSNAPNKPWTSRGFTHIWDHSGCLKLGLVGFVDLMIAFGYHVIGFYRRFNWFNQRKEFLWFFEGQPTKRWRYIV